VRQAEHDHRDAYEQTAQRQARVTQRLLDLSWDGWAAGGRSEGHRSADGRGRVSDGRVAGG